MATSRRWRLVRARGDGAPHRARRMVRPRHRLRAVLVSLLGAGVVAAGLWVLLGTGVLGVRSVEVTGVQVTTAEAVRAAAGVAEGTPLLRLDTGAIAERVRTLPPVAQVDVRRSLPHTLVIAVTERTPAAVVPGPDGFAVLAADGVVYHHAATPPSGVPVLRLDAPGPGDPATMAALRVAAALTPELTAVLAEIVAPAPTRISLTLVDGRTVVWGDPESSDLKAVVATTLLDQAANEIDVSAYPVATVS